MVKEWLSTSVNDAIDRYNKPGNALEKHTNHSTTLVRLLTQIQFPLEVSTINFELSNEGVDLGYGFIQKGQTKNVCLN